MKKTYLIAAASSGSGKTTITMGILRALARKGLDVQPFKCGPDYIDTQYHQIACGKESINLDIWMNGEEAVRQLVNASTSDIKIIEGAMGLYDGADGMTGSAAHVAEVVGAEVILVVNSRSMAHSVAPLLYGYLHWRPQTRLRAVIFNNVGSPRHAEALRRAAKEVGIDCWGFIPRQKDLYSPSRHLGLDLTERERIAALADRMADVLSTAAVIPELSEKTGMSGKAGEPTQSITSAPSKESSPLAGELESGLGAGIYIARDDAFNFIYAETIHLLRKYFKVHFFSPLANETVPADADVVYLPGGYPELFTQQLAQSTATMESLRQTRARIIAECGGMMYLGQAIDDAPMTGLLPFSTTMKGARLHLGYRQMNWNGQTLRGHEFHYSTASLPETFLNSDKLKQGLFNAQGDSVDTFVYAHGRIIASYVHWGPSSLLKLIMEDHPESG